MLPDVLLGATSHMKKRLPIGVSAAETGRNLLIKSAALVAPWLYRHAVHPRLSSSSSRQSSPPHADMSVFYEEGRELMKLGLPAVATNLFATLMLIADRSSSPPRPTESAAPLGSAYWNVVWYFMLGVSTALTRSRRRRTARATAMPLLLIAAAVLLALCVPAAAILWVAEWVVLNAFGQSAEIRG